MQKIVTDRDSKKCIVQNEYSANISKYNIKITCFSKINYVQQQHQQQEWEWESATLSPLLSPLSFNRPPKRGVSLVEGNWE